MEIMGGKYLELVKRCISFAREFMTLPDQIESYFDDCPSNRFKTMKYVAEGKGNKLYFNKPWFTEQDRWQNHQDDIEFFVFHELRHLHQHYEIALMENDMKLSEKEDTVALWKNGFINYKRNEGGVTQIVNVSQEVEIDANAYALCLLNFFHINDDVALHLSVPQEAMELADTRSKQYYKTKPELKRYFDKYRKEMGQLVMKKPERNDPCPCGSGKKFKKCCISKGIYN